MEILSYSSCRTSAILKYFCPLKGADQTVYMQAGMRLCYASVTIRPTVD